MDIENDLYYNSWYENEILISVKDLKDPYPFPSHCVLLKRKNKGYERK